jgi:uncharacterized membrane protein
MNNDKKIEYFFAATAYLGIILSIIIRDDMNAPDRFLTVAMIQGVVWLAFLFFRMNRDKLAGLNDSLGATITKPEVVTQTESK